MKDHSEKIKSAPFEPKITFSGAGVLHVKSSEIVQTENAKRQIKALGELKEKGLFSSVMQ